MRRVQNGSAWFVGVVLTVVILVAVPAGAQSVPVGTSPCPGVRPGAHISTGKTGGTLNFVFRGSDGHRYIGTAGHLFADEQTLTWRKDGPSVAIDDGTVIGKAAFAWNYGDRSADFALIRLARGVEVEASMCHWGGPTGINDDLSDDPTLLRLYGNGVGIGEAFPARTMVAPVTDDEDLVTAVGVAIFGDSGSPVISEDGRAMGVQFATGFYQQGPGTVGVYRLGPQVAEAERALGISIRLVKAPLAEN